MKRIILLATIICLFFAVNYYVDNNLLETTVLEIEHADIPIAFNEFRILHISDLHSKEFGKNNQHLINAIDKIAPNIVVLTGDMVAGDKETLQVFYDLAEKLVSQYPTYFVPGNHEIALGRELKKELYQTLENIGVIRLDNDVVTLKRGEEKVNLYGLWYGISYYQVKNLELNQIKQLLGEPENTEYNILLTHQPKYFKLYAEWGADLIMAGHVHGGMVRLPFVGAVFSPNGDFFPEYSTGEYQLEGSSMIVSRGLGPSSKGFRVFNRPELVLIILKTT